MEEKEYDFNVEFTVCFEGDCLGKLSLGDLKKKLDKEIESFLEANDNVSEYSVYGSEMNTDYEEME